jgi:hypothetical protein
MSGCIDPGLFPIVNIKIKNIPIILKCIKFKINGTLIFHSILNLRFIFMEK